MGQSQTNDQLVKEELQRLHDRYMKRWMSGEEPGFVLLSELLQELDDWAKEPYNHE